MKLDQRKFSETLFNLESPDILLINILVSLLKPVNFNEIPIENGIQFVFSFKTENDF